MRWIKRFFLTLCSSLVLSISLPSTAHSCSCVDVDTDGFLSEGSSISLPSNARGVLYYKSRWDSYPLTEASLETALVGSIPPPVTEKVFSITDDTDRKNVDVRVQRLSINPFNSSKKPIRYGRLKDKAREACTIGYNAADECQKFYQLQSERGQWISKLFQAGEVDDVTADVSKGIGLFRIEPKGGLKPGHHYTFTAAGKGARLLPPGARGSESTLAVAVDTAALPNGALAETVFEADGSIETTLLPVASGGSCSESVLAEVQRLRFKQPQSLEPYRKAMVFFTTYRGPEQESSFTSWHYSNSACGGTRLGRSQVGLGQDLFYTRCSAESPFPGLKPGVTYSVKGYFGLLEVEDSLRETNTIQINFPVLREGECTAGKHLGDVIGTNDDQKIKEQVCQFAGWSGGSFEDNPIALIENLVGPLKHSNVEIRRCAAKAFEGLRYGTQSGSSLAALNLLATMVLPALDDLVRNEADSKTLVSALKSLNALVMELRSVGMSSKVSYETIADDSANALNNSDAAVRIAAAETMAELGFDAKSAVSKLLAAVRSKERPNYAAPTALLGVDPFNPETTPALLDALDSPDSNMAGAAATALGRVGAFDKRVVPALVNAVEQKHNSNAIEALGELGPQSTSAVPLLLKIAKEGDYSFQRKYAMVSLAQIGEQPEAVSAVILQNIRQPLDQYARQYSIEALGMLGPAGKNALEEVLKLLDSQLSDYEQSTLLQTVRRIGSPTLKTNAAIAKLVDSKQSNTRTTAADLLLASPLLDGGTLARLIRSSHPEIKEKAIRAVSADLAGSIVDKEPVLAALTEIIRSKTISSRDADPALRAALSFVPHDPKICSAVQDRENSTADIYERQSIEQLRKESCP